MKNSRNSELVLQGGGHWGEEGCSRPDFNGVNLFQLQFCNSVIYQHTYDFFGYNLSSLDSPGCPDSLVQAAPLNLLQRLKYTNRKH